MFKIWFLGFCLNFGITILICVMISIEGSHTTYQLTNFLQNNVPVLQKLVVIFGDGTALFIAMNKRLQFHILKKHKFNFDQCGFFAFDAVDHIQTLVGSPGKLNYIHDSDFNSKKIIGT